MDRTMRVFPRHTHLKFLSGLASFNVHQGEDEAITAGVGGIPEVIICTNFIILFPSLVVGELFLRLYLIKKLQKAWNERIERRQKRMDFAREVMMIIKNAEMDDSDDDSA